MKLINHDCLPILMLLYINVYSAYLLNAVYSACYEINKFVTYCKINFLELNVKKTKEMIINFRKSKALPDPIIINDHTVERVRTYKYLGVMLNNDLSWSSNTDYIISKLNSRLYCL